MSEQSVLTDERKIYGKQLVYMPVISSNASLPLIEELYAILVYMIVSQYLGHSKNI